MKKLLLISFASWAITFTPANAQSVDQAKHLLDVWLEAQKDYNDWPSLSVSFVKDQKIIYAKSFGYANPEAKIKATPDTLYRIASISKLFTSISIMQLRDAGKLDLRDPVSKHLDWYNIKQKYPLSDDVSIEGMLSHSSGLPREVDIPHWSYSEGYPFPNRQEMMKITQNQETLYRAWDQYQYSNLGFVLAGEIVASTSGESYHEYVRKNILVPMGLTNTFSDVAKEKHGHELAVGYSSLTRDRVRKEIPFLDTKAIAPAASFASSANDLAKFAMWQLKLINGKGDNILDHNTLREMQRPHSVINDWSKAFGVGFQLRNEKGATLVGHGGLYLGYRTQILINPKQGIGGIALFSTHSISPDQIVLRMMDIFGPILKRNSGKPDASNNPEVNLVVYQGFYDSQPWDDEIYVMPWGNKLISFSLTTDNPMTSMTRLKHVEGDKFVRLRSDNSEAEITTFLRNNEGDIIGYKEHSTIITKKIE